MIPDSRQSSLPRPSLSPVFLLKPKSFCHASNPCCLGFLFLMEVICMLVFMEHSVSPKSSPTFSQILKAEEASAGTASQTEVTYFSVPAWFAPACYCCLCRRKRGGMKSSSSTHRMTTCRVFLLLFFSFFPFFFEVSRQNILINCVCTYLYTYI